jgi:DNA polymerase I
MKHLILDANNLLFRARHACFRRNYDHVIVHTFFRSIKPLVEKFEPDCVYFVLDGKPKKRLELQSDYKGTREYHDKDGFSVQRKKSIDMIKECVPFLVMRHPEMEADDVIADLAIHTLPKDHEKIIISSDTDFIQLCQLENNDVKLYNPIKKEYRLPPEYPYALWKALRGDSADNISGIRGIGNKRATALLTEPGALEAFFESKGSDVKSKYLHNIEMIELRKMTNEEFLQVDMSWSEKPFDVLRDTFTQMKLKSMITDKAWTNYSSPFGGLKDGRDHFIKR